MGKGEIAGYKQLLLFPLFSRLVLQTRKKQGLFGKGLNTCKCFGSHIYIHCMQIKLDMMGKKSVSTHCDTRFQMLFQWLLQAMRELLSASF